MDPQQCPVCCEKFSKLVRKPVRCPRCPYVACRACTCKYLLESCVEAACMGCKGAWDYAFLQDNFSKRWVATAWREHVAATLLRREQSMLPRTQEEQLAGYLQFLETERSLRHANQQIGELERRLRDLLQQRSRLQRTSEALRLTQFRSSARDAELQLAAAGEPRHYFACPVDGCRGLVDRRWECGVCSARVCQDCRAPLPVDGGAAHECDPQDRATFALLKRDTRPCPHCRAPITRTEGCPQMWCTNCNNAFDWRTGRPIAGEVHNPHYMEYRERLGRQGALDDYGRDRDPLVLAHYALRKLDGMARCETDPDVIRRVVNRVRDVRIHLRCDLRTNEPRDYWYERLQFLTNQLTEAQFKNRLYAEERGRLRSTEYSRLFRDFLDEVLPTIAVESAAIAADQCCWTRANEAAENIVATYEAARARHRPRLEELDRRWGGNGAEKL